ncbi:MAG: response regulator [Prochlorotrichaceae cyanobacterium]
MPDFHPLVEIADQLVESDTGSMLNAVQRQVLAEILASQTKAKTYDQIATESGYSSGYVKVMASDLWKLLSKVLGKKVTKANVQAILQQHQQGEFGTAPSPRSSSSTETTIAPSLEAFIRPHSPKGLSETQPPVENDRAGKSTILVVDDQIHNANLLTQVLEQDDYEVWQASSGQEALHMVEKITPDLILLDVNMPDMDGYTVCQQIKANQQTADIPVIFVSAAGGAWDKVKGFSVGGSDYITKPFNTLEAIVRIETQLKLHQKQGQSDSEGKFCLSEDSGAAVILMVDDEASNLKLLADVLENEGYEVWQAESGAEALRVIQKVVPHLILLDVNLPDQSGYEICQHLKSQTNTKHIPIIFASAADETWDKVKAFSVGASDYITKPVQVIELMARIKHQLNLLRC